MLPKITKISIELDFKLHVYFNAFRYDRMKDEILRFVRWGIDECYLPIEFGDMFLGYEFCTWVINRNISLSEDNTFRIEQAP